MSILIPLLVILSCALVISSFGRRLSARKSLLWIGILVFLIVASFLPQALQPLATFLGIQLASNFFFGIMTVFLLTNAFIEAATMSELLRRSRDTTSFLASQNFLRMNKFPEATDVLVVVPCFNEESVIAKTATEINAQFSLIRSSGFHPALVIVNDASNDGTQHLLEEKFTSQYTEHAQNIGVSGVLNTGFKIARSLNVNYVVQFDGDGQHPANRIADLLVAAQKTEADLLIGSRFFEASDLGHKSTTRARALGTRFIVLVLKIFRRTGRITDPTSGFRVYSKRAMALLLKELPEDYPEPESIALASVHRLKIEEIHVDMEARSTGQSSLNSTTAVIYMIKVTSALIGLRLRSLLSKAF